MNADFSLIIIIIIERYQTCSILMLSVISALHHVLLFMDRIWLLVVPVETEVDLQLLQTKCVVIQLAVNKSRRVSNLVQFSKYSSVLESFWLIAGYLHFNKGLQFCFMEDVAQSNYCIILLK